MGAPKMADGLSRMCRWHYFFSFHSACVVVSLLYMGRTEQTGISEATSVWDIWRWVAVCHLLYHEDSCASVQLPRLL